MIIAFLDIIAELAPWLLLGAAASALLHWLVPKHWLSTHLSGRTGVLKAVALGVPLPLCSCGVIPAGVGLKRDGASTGSAVGFLVATPQTGVDSVLVTASMLGWPFALYKVGAAALTGVTAGWLADAVDPGVAPGPAPSQVVPRPTLRAAIDHAIEVLRSIWRWLVFGIAVSALLTVYVPADALSETVLGVGAFAVLAVLALSVPLYVCATASVPIAASLVAAGLPTSAALVFLMAGPATNVATMGAVQRTFGGRVLGVYLGTVVVGSVGLGLAFDALFSTTVVAGMNHDHTGPVAIASAVVLGALLLWFAIEDARAWLRPAARTDAPAIELDVSGMTCGGCARKLTTALLEVDGVEAVDVDHDAGKAVVRGHAQLSALHQATTGAGFTVAAAAQ